MEVCVKCGYKKETELHPLGNKYLCVSFNPEKLGCSQKLSQRINYAITSFFNAILLKGEKNNQAKLNPDQVRKIRGLLKNPDNRIKDIAAEFNVTETSIRSIKRNQTWQHLND